jgi:hypothetical protein
MPSCLISCRSRPEGGGRRGRREAGLCGQHGPLYPTGSRGGKRGVKRERDAHTFGSRPYGARSPPASSPTTRGDSRSERVEFVDYLQALTIAVSQSGTGQRAERPERAGVETQHSRASCRPDRRGAGGKRWLRVSGCLQ